MSGEVHISSSVVVGPVDDVEYDKGDGKDESRGLVHEPSFVLLEGGTGFLRLIGNNIIRESIL